MQRSRSWILALVLAAIAPEQLQSALDPSGVYRCDGVSDGQAYLAAVQIVRHGDTYLVRWLTREGVVNVGVGVVIGSTFTVGYTGASSGVVVYRADATQRLSGEWVDLDVSGTVNRETLTKVADNEPIVVPERAGVLVRLMPDARSARFAEDTNGALVAVER